jgi:hypothetical protein
MERQGAQSEGKDRDRARRRNETTTHLVPVLRGGPRVVLLLHADPLGVPSLGPIRLDEALERLVASELPGQPSANAATWMRRALPNPLPTFIFLSWSSDHLSMVILLTKEMCTPNPARVS